MQVCPSISEVQHASLSKDIVPFSYIEIVRRNAKDQLKEMMLHVENVFIPYKFSMGNSLVVEVAGNTTTKNRLYKNTRNSNMEKRITRAVSLAQKE